MYETYWNLNQKPFEDYSKPESFFRSQSHQAALLKLRYLVEHGKGAGLLTGGVGLGKTYLSQVLEAELPETFRPIVRISYPQLTPTELLTDLTVHLGEKEADVFSDNFSVDRILRIFEERIEQLTTEGLSPVFIIDDVHFIDNMKVFQTLQLLLNLRQPGVKEFSLVLLADQPFLGKVQRMGQFNDRLAVKSFLQPLSFPETASYIQHRLQTAGTDQPIFQEEALLAIFEISGGIPRRINRLADLALLVGFADGLTNIAAKQIEAVSTELLMNAAA